MAPALVWVVTVLSAKQPAAPTLVWGPRRPVGTVRLWAMGWAGSVVPLSEERPVPVLAGAMVPALVWVVPVLSAELRVVALVWAALASAAARRQRVALAGGVSQPAVVPAS
jgi:hypothetical protein